MENKIKFSEPEAKKVAEISTTASKIIETKIKGKTKAEEKLLKGVAEEKAAEAQDRKSRKKRKTLKNKLLPAKA